MPHGDTSSPVLPVPSNSAGVKKRAQEACQCLCTPMLCLLFSGDSPSSLAAFQDLFSPSLYVTTNRTTEAALPSFLFFPLPAPVFLTLPFWPSPSPTSSWESETWARISGHMTHYPATYGIMKYHHRQQSPDLKHRIRGFWKKCPLELSKCPGSGMGCTICLQEKHPTGRRGMTDWK